MLVRKFEADTIDEALKNIKKELGPDAVILKTTTNKGIKGAFKKNKIEVTAAISEKNLSKKSNVDKVLKPEQREEFYAGSSQYISNMIDRHEVSKNKSNSKNKNAGYGSIGLNKNVSLNKELSVDDLEDELIKLQGERENGLDVFLNTKPIVVERVSRNEIDDSDLRFSPTTNHQSNEKINDLERKVVELSKLIERVNKVDPVGIYSARAMLKAYGINDDFIHRTLKKALLDLDKNEQEDESCVLDFAMKEMSQLIFCEKPLFILKDKPTVTLLISDHSVGQSFITQKMSHLNKDSVILKNLLPSDINDSASSSFAEKVFGIDVFKTQQLSEIISRAKKEIDLEKNVFIDYKVSDKNINDAKKFIDGLRRSFLNVEVLITLSSINSELYNKKIAHTYRSLSDGIVFTFLDECLSYGDLFNVLDEFHDLPIKYFGTGRVFPNDIEEATVERVIAKVFNLK